MNLAGSEGDPGGGDPGADGLRDRAQRLLLLPALGDADTPLVQARPAVAEALMAVGLRPDTAGEFAARLLGDPARQEPRWVLAPESPIPVRTSDYSPRRVPLALGTTEERALVLAEALQGR
ncbi:hypothetical protein ACFWIQ_03055 [Kitasatospora sp. NPDC127059]|uniref:hypothetical protein n=1 Tax=unclassified Kitasatospora TaxID=2633591 RepID=UPI00365398C1